MRGLEQTNIAVRSEADDYQYTWSLTSTLVMETDMDAPSESAVNTEQFTSVVDQTAGVIFRVVLPIICSFGILGIILTVG